MNTGRNALVTGAGRGIGLEICKALFRTNLEKLCVADVESNNIAMEMLRNDFPGKTVIYQNCDMSKKDELDQCYKETMSQFKYLDIIVNNAAILNDSDCDLSLQTNLCGVINSSLIAMNHMSKENGGRGGYIINIAGTAGLGPSYLLPIYSSSKWGVIGFTRCMGYNDYYYNRTGVKFIAVCPGVTMTNINDNLKDKFILKELKSIFDKEIVAKAYYQDIAVTGYCVLRALEADKNGSVFLCDLDQIKREKLTEFTQEFVTKNLKS